MWHIIANVSALVTLILFILYLIGHIWTVYIQRDAIFEKIDFENIDKDADIDFIDCTNYSGYGRIFSISSPLGIRKISIYSVEINGENIKEPFSKGKCLKEIENIKQNIKVYVKADFIGIPPSLFIDIERADYIITSFGVADSGRDGSFVQTDYKSKMTFKSWLYYLCK